MVAFVLGLGRGSAYLWRLWVRGVRYGGLLWFWTVGEILVWVLGGFGFG